MKARGWCVVATLLGMFSIPLAPPELAESGGLDRPTSPEDSSGDLIVRETIDPGVLPSPRDFPGPAWFARADEVKVPWTDIATTSGGGAARPGGDHVDPATMVRPRRVAAMPGIATTDVPVVHGAGGRVTQAEVNALATGLEETLQAIESELVYEVFEETLPLVGNNFGLAWANNAPGFRYLTTLRSAISQGLATLGSSPDYAPSDVATAINGRLTALGFASGSAVVVTTDNDHVQLAFTTTDTINSNTVPVEADFGLPNLRLQLTSAANAQTTVSAAFAFTAGVDGAGFYLQTAGSDFQFDTNTTAGSLSGNGTFCRLPHAFSRNSSFTPQIPANFDITLADADGKIRSGELADDLLQATVTGNTRLALRLASTLPASVMMPQVGTDLVVLWNFNADTVDPDDGNEEIGNQPLLSLNNNRINLESFFNSFAVRVLDEVDRITDPLQPVIDVLTAEVPLLSDLGSGDLTMLALLGASEETVAAIGGLEALVELSDTAQSFTGNGSVFSNLGSLAVQGADLRTDPLDDFGTGILAVIPANQDADLVNFKNDAWAIPGLSFPLLEDPLAVGNVLLGRNASLFEYETGEIAFSTEFRQYFPVLGPVGVTLGGRLSLQTQFGFGYDMQGLFDYYDGGSTDASLLANGFYALASDPEGNPLTGITLEAGLTAGIEANILIASAGVEGDVTATIGIYLDDLLGDEDGRVRLSTLNSTPFDEWFYAAGSLSAGLRAYLEVGWPPFGVSFEFDSPRVVLLSFDSQDDATPVLASPDGSFPGGLQLNVGERAPFRLVGDTDDRAEEFKVANDGFDLAITFFDETVSYPQPARLAGHGNLRGDTITVEEDVSVPVHFTGGDGQDLLAGGAGNDLLEGGDKADKLRGRAGNDTLLGGADNDELNGGSGTNTLDGGTGDDTASWSTAELPLVLDLRDGTFAGAAASDTLISIERYRGTSFDDTMHGSEGLDQLLAGGGGDDTIEGHGGGDQLEGNSGADMIDGGEGDDLINGGSGADILDGGPGTDTLTYLGAEIPVSASLLAGTGTGGDAAGDVLSGFEILVGSALPKELESVLYSGDTLAGSDQGETIFGMDGADDIFGNGGDDLIYGNHPDIPTSMREGFDPDHIEGGGGNDVIHGQASDDELFGGEGDDTLHGGSDDDELDGGPGSDVLAGDEGDDHLLDNDLTAADSLAGGAGYDRLSADYSNQSADLTFVVGAENQFTFPDGNGFSEMETLGILRTGSGNDRVRLAASQEPTFYPKLVDAGPGDDLVVADRRGYYPGPQRSPDSLHGGEGNDTISFEQSIDSITANLATPSLGGAAAGMTMSGFENLIGSDYPDVLTGDAGPNIITAGLSLRDLGGTYDQVTGGAGVDTLRADYSADPRVNEFGISMTPNWTAGAESIALGQAYTPAGTASLLYYTGIEIFEITGGAMPDRIYAEDSGFGGFPDRFHGLGGDDFLYARAGDDYLDGGEGNDYLGGDTGNDTVIGGPGNDTIRLQSSSGYGSDTVDAGPGDDLVKDYRDLGSNSLGAGTTSGNPSDVFRFDGGSGIDTLQADLGFSNIPIVFDEHSPTEISLPNGGYIRNFERIGAVTLTTGDDILILEGRANNQIGPNLGNDLINPGLGIDTINSGMANDGEDTVILDYSVLDDDDTTGVTISNSFFQRRSISTNVLLDQIYPVIFEHSIITGTRKVDTFQGRSDWDHIDAGSGDDVVTGQNGNDILLGGPGNDDLNGQTGNDFIDGGPGTDILRGEGGNDLFIVDDAGDVVSEGTGGGNDTVMAGTSYTLSANIENLILTGVATAGTGNASANTVTGNRHPNVLRGEAGNDVLDGGGLSGEIDRLNGGVNADTFVLGDGTVRYHDDGNPADPGLGSYAVIVDFTPSQSDKLRLTGNAAAYLLGPSPVADPGTALYHDSNGNGTLEPESDELVAVLVSGESLTPANTVANAVFPAPPSFAEIGLLAPLQVESIDENGLASSRVAFEISDPMPADYRLEIQTSTDLGQTDDWRTIASRDSSGGWTGTAQIAAGTPADGKVGLVVTVPSAAGKKHAFFRARLTRP